MSKISIYIASHVIFRPPKDPIYIPMEAGAALHRLNHYKGDDTGYNISLRNKNFCELSVQYWAWKNDHTSDVKGLNHYRRYLTSDDGSHALNKQEIEEILRTKDCIINGSDSGNNNYDSGFDGSVYQNYASCHHAHDMDLALEFIQNNYPEDYQAFAREMFHTDLDSCCNLFIAPAKIFDEYSAWLFPIFFYIDRRINVSKYDDYNQRVYGFMGERILRCWLNMRGYSFKGCNVGDLGNDRFGN